MANQWFKFFGVEYLGDQKMLKFNALERSCWLTLLCYASQHNGVVEYLSEYSLMIQSGVQTPEDMKRTKGVLDKFQNAKMIQIDNGVITVLNWKKRQETYSEGYERVKRWREKKRFETLQSNGKSRIEENRIEENREGECTPSQISRDFFSKGKTYQEYLDIFSKGKDLSYIQREFEKFILYWTEPNKSGTKVKWEQQDTFDVKRRLFTWLNRSFETRRPLQVTGRGLA